MIKLISRVTSVSLLALLATGCMYNKANTETAMIEPTEPHTVALTGGGPIGGYIEQFMDGTDKTKLSRALDKGIGSTTAWKNPASGADFSVTPTRKVTSDGGGICRAYTVRMTKTGITDKVQGTACVGRDGMWKVAG